MLETSRFGVGSSQICSLEGTQDISAINMMNDLYSSQMKEVSAQDPSDVTICELKDLTNTMDKQI